MCTTIDVFLNAPPIGYKMVNIEFATWATNNVEKMRQPQRKYCNLTLYSTLQNAYMYDGYLKYKITPCAHNEYTMYTQGLLHVYTMIIPCVHNDFSMYAQ